MRFVFLFLIVDVVKAENPQADKLFQDYFEWKIDTFKVNFMVSLDPFFNQCGLILDQFGSL